MNNKEVNKDYEGMKVQKFEICQKLSNEVYNDFVKEDFDGWIKLQHEENELTKQKSSAINVLKKKNFACTAYKKDNEIIIAFRGTDDKKDIIEDIRIALNKGLKSDDFAHEFADKIIKENPSCSIIFTGHSLGGAYAQLACVKQLISGVDCSAYTFNAPGMAPALKEDKYRGQFENKRITNYVIMNDFIGNYRAHVGYTYYFQPFPMDKKDEAGNLQSPHGCIRTCSQNVLGGLVSKVFLKQFGSKNGLALWCLDTKNKTDKKYIKILRISIRKKDLQKAIEIIERCEKIKMLNEFEYKLGRKNYRLS